jgi:hypothetical protein
MNAIATLFLALSVMIVTAFFLITRKRGTETNQPQGDRTMKRTLAVGLAALLASTGIARRKGTW